ncbi:hypothetical protein LCGC14_0448590 [marine sediment metagenome]|uniref:Uncharacterized protein n=1 Tax=marine sediment metagenome TaxID=412755 RepID=A0A0F9VSB9_9ZZZZ
MSNWIHTGGGWYENEETKERIRGKKNLPLADDLQPEDNESDDNEPFTTAVEVEEVETTEIVCMACSKVTAHTQRASDSQDWGIYICNECGGKTRVSLK